MIFALLSLLGLAAGFGGLAWGYFVLGPRERAKRVLDWQLDYLSEAIADAMGCGKAWCRAKLVAALDPDPR